MMKIFEKYVVCSKFVSVLINMRNALLEIDLKYPMNDAPSSVGKKKEHDALLLKNSRFKGGKACIMENISIQKYFFVVLEYKTTVKSSVKETWQHLFRIQVLQWESIFILSKCSSTYA